MHRKRKPKVGEIVCDCRYNHQRIITIEDDGDTVILEDNWRCSYENCCDVPVHTWKHPTLDEVAAWRRSEGIPEDEIKAMYEREGKFYVDP